MGALTGVFYACLAVYLGGWYTGRWTGNFSLLLFVLTVVTLLFWLAERLHFAPGRAAAAKRLEQEDSARREKLAQQGIAKVDGDISQARETLLMQPWWLDWTAGLFPVILAVFLLRSFLFEPFKIPSGSMMPTLLVGDLILVNKFHYGVRLPVINKKIIPVNDPQRGDVMVFRYPSEPSMDYIKRVVGLPGDEVAYRNQQLYLNGQLVVAQRKDDFLDEEGPGPSEVDVSGRVAEKSSRYVPQFSEKLGSTEHRILVNPERMANFHPIVDFPNRDHCRYSPEGGVTCKVPVGHYFMMGDNRDNSQDSRYWGFVPDANIVGKAFFVWMNFSSIKRIGPFQ